MTFQTDGCAELYAGEWTCAGDPVKLAGTQGLFRFVKLLTPTSAEIVGPYFPNSPQRTKEVTRVKHIVNLSSAPKASRRDVTMTVAATDASNRAKRK